MSFHLLFSWLWSDVVVAWFCRFLPVPLLLLPACANPTLSPGWGPPSRGWGTPGGTVPASYQQCINPYGASNPACVAAGVTTKEVAGSVSAGAGRAAETAVRVAEAIQGFITVTRFLDASQKKTVESILTKCVREANREVDEKLFGKGRSLPDSECGKEPPVKDKLAPTWRRHLGILKHAAAFSCIQKHLEKEYPGNFSIEPRLRKDEITEEVLLTRTWKGSLKPDVVIHFTRDVTRVQCIYDLKFPCGYEVGNPWSMEVQNQMDLYAGLGGECYPAIVTPIDGVLHNPALR